MSSMAYAYRVGRSTVSQVISETCDALWEVLQDELLEPSDENWKRIAAEFNNCWQFPRCIGAIDSKHVAIKVSQKTIPKLFKDICDTIVKNIIADLNILIYWIFFVLVSKQCWLNVL